MSAPIANPMARTDGSMTFDWIFFVIVAIPMVFAAWELVKTSKVVRENQLRSSRK